jgi:hypothetical protein
MYVQITVRPSSGAVHNLTQRPRGSRHLVASPYPFSYLKYNYPCQKKVPYIAAVQEARMMAHVHGSFVQARKSRHCAL